MTTVEHDDAEWITVEEAASILHLGVRGTHRYAERGRLATRRAGRRLLFYRPDVEALAQDLKAASRFSPSPASPKPDLVPAGEMLAYLRERDQQLAEQQQQVTILLARLAEAQAELNRRLLPQDERQLRDELAAVVHERDELRRQIDALRPWYRRWYVWMIVALVLALVVALLLGFILAA